MFASFFISLAIVFGQIGSFSFVPQGRTTIEGRVTTTDGRPFPDIRVFLQNEVYSPVKTAYTDNSGRFRFDAIPAGVYYLQAEPGGADYELLKQRVDAVGMFRRGGTASGELFHVDLVLRPRKIGNSDTKGVVFLQAVPDAAKKEYQIGLKSLESAAFANATSSLKRAIEIFPDYYDALELLGTEYVKRQDYPAALPLLTRAVELNKNGWRGFYSLGIAQVELNKATEAVQSLRRAVELNPTSPNTNMHLGIALAQKNETRGEAIEALKKVTVLSKTGVPRVYYYLAALYIKNRQYGEAASALESFLHADPTVGDQDKIREKIKELRQKASEAKP
jgi:tetratricopeptide (TPR) repeat protein